MWNTCHTAVKIKKLELPEHTQENLGKLSEKQGTGRMHVNLELVVWNGGKGAGFKRCI